MSPLQTVFSFFVFHEQTNNWKKFILKLCKDIRNKQNVKPISICATVAITTVTAITDNAAWKYTLTVLKYQQIVAIIVVSCKAEPFWFVVVVPVAGAKPYALKLDNNTPQYLFICCS